MMKAIKIGDIFDMAIYNDKKEPCKLINIYKCGDIVHSIDIERLSDGKCFRQTGLSIKIKSS